MEQMCVWGGDIKRDMLLFWGGGGVVLGAATLTRSGVCVCKHRGMN
jgi:hypothetical protein